MKHIKPTTLAEARALVGQEVSKEFYESDTQLPRLFEGVVEGVRANKTQPELQLLGEFLYLVKYEDGDEEELGWEMLDPILTGQGQGKPIRVKREPPASAPEPSSRSKRRESPVQHEQQENEDAEPHEGVKAGKRSRRANEGDIEVSRQTAPLSAHTNLNGRDPSEDVTKLMQQRARVISQAAARSAGPAGTRTQGLPGQLKSITLKDFMCHEHFTVDFGPHVTLVSGSNGSGKSAIMQGLQACLGVTARKTGRGTSLAHFIRTEADSATVQVTLWNDGPEAECFQPEVYGKTLTVERVIRKKGGEYRLLTCKGAVVSRKKDDLDAVLDFFSTDASNPLAIITQDMARDFNSGKADDKRKKFLMFMEGTLLQDIRDSINQSHETLATTRGLVKEGMNNLRDLRLQHGQVTLRLAKLSDVEKLNDLLAYWEAVVGWSTCWEASWKQQEAQAVVDANAASQVEAGRHQALHDAEALVVQIKTKLMHKLDENRRAEQAGQQKVVEVAALKKRFDDAKHIKKLLAVQVRDASADLTRVANDKRDFEAQLVEGADKEKVQEVQQKLAEFQQQIEAKTTAIAEIETQYKSVREQFHISRDHEQELKKSLSTWDRNQGRSETEAQKYRQELQSMGNTERNKAQRFGGDSVVKLNRNISERRGSFRAAPPIGPLGMYLSLSDSKWNVAVEVALGQLIYKYITFCGEDSNVLKSMGGQAGMGNRLSIMGIRGFQPRHRVTNAPQGYSSVLDVITITHPDSACADAIYNILVDFGKLETLLLVDTAQEAREIVYDRKFGGHFNAVDISGTSVKRTGANSVSVSAKGSSIKMPKFEADASQVRRQLQDALQREVEGVAQAAGKQQGIRTQLDEAIRKSQYLTTEQARLQLCKRGATRDLNNMEAQQNELQPTGDAPADEVMRYATQQVQECQIALATTQIQLDTHNESMRQAVEVENAAKEAFNRRRQEEANGDELINLMKEIDELAQLEGHANWDVKKAQEDLQTLKARVAETVQTLQTLTAQAEESRQQAEQVCPLEEAETAKVHVEKYLREKYEAEASRPGKRARVQTEGQLQEKLAKAFTTDGASREYEAITLRQKEAMDEVGGSAEDLKYESEKLWKQIVKRDLLVKTATTSYDLFTQAFNKRQAAFEDLVHNVTMDTTNNFNMYMGRRGNMGTIEFDHETRELTLAVKVNGKKDPTATSVTDLKILSGGERSYTTVAFLLAVGKHCETKFRCLDEFDVFMDPVNRRIATQTLLEFALDNDERQYVLLTPQDIQAVEDAKQELARKKKLDLPASFVRIVQIKNARAAS